jgi:hypothetical protein
MLPQLAMLAAGISAKIDIVMKSVRAGIVGGPIFQTRITEIDEFVVGTQTAIGT